MSPKKVQPYFFLNVIHNKVIKEFEERNTRNKKKICMDSDTQNLKGHIFKMIKRFMINIIHLRNCY